MDQAFALLFLSHAHIFLPWEPPAVTNTTWVMGTKAGQHGSPSRVGELSRKSSWVLSRTHDGRVVRSPGVAVCSARCFALLLEEEEEEAVFFITCFPLSCSQIFCLFLTVPFMCFSSLQKSLALFKIDLEQLPRLYPEREKNVWMPSSYRVIKSFHSPSRIHQKPGLLKKSSE